MCQFVKDMYILIVFLVLSPYLFPSPHPFLHFSSLFNFTPATYVVNNCPQGPPVWAVCRTYILFSCCSLSSCGLALRIFSNILIYFLLPHCVGLSDHLVLTVQFFLYFASPAIVSACLSFSEFCAPCCLFLIVIVVSSFLGLPHVFVRYFLSCVLFIISGLD